MKGATKEKIKKELGACMNTSKWIVIFLYFAIFVFGIALVIVGIVIKANVSFPSNFRIPAIASLPYWLISLGFLLAIVSIVGVVGTCTLNRVLMILFVSCLCLLGVIQIGIGITSYLERKNLPVVIDAAWTHAENETRIYVETEWKCCGLYNTTDRPASKRCNATAFDDTDEAHLEDWSSWDNGGCMYELLKYCWDKAEIAGGAILGVTLAEFLTVALVGALICRVRKLEDKYDKLDEEDKALSKFNDEI